MQIPGPSTRPTGLHSGGWRPGHVCASSPPGASCTLMQRASRSSDHRGGETPAAGALGTVAPVPARLSD